MKILFALDYPEGGTFHVASSLAPHLRALGHEVTLWYKDQPPPDLAEFDLAHAWNMRAGIPLRDRLPLVQTINSFLPQFASGYYEAARRADAVHTHSPYVAQLLHLTMNGLCSTFIPVAFDQEPFAPLPPPPKFTLGWIGSDRSFKRFEVAREIATKAGVPFVEWDVDKLHPWEKVAKEFFPSISCYLLASFNDAGPLPPQEALLFGRPVISTCVGMMNMVVRDEQNGLFFDGSVEGGVEAVKIMQEHFERFREGALNTWLPDPKDLAPRYERLYRRVLNG